MASDLPRREAAKVAFVKMDSGSRVRRARLARSTLTRGPFTVGAYVYSGRTLVRPGESSAPLRRWFGIARVIGDDFRDPDKMADRGSMPRFAWQPRRAALARLGGGTVFARPG